MIRRIELYTLLAFTSVCLLLFVACDHRVNNPVIVQKQPDIYPDYIGVTIPAGIAPLNFNVLGTDVQRVDVVARGSKGGEIHVNGEYADFDIDEWHELTEQNIGGEIVFTVCAMNDGQWKQYADFKVFVSRFPLEDYGLTYRLIPPGYEIGGPRIGIFQRNIHTFEQQPVLEESAVSGHCMNCHTSNQTDPSLFTLQIRGEGGGTLIQRDGVQTWLNTKTEVTKAAGSYAYWHPSGRYCAYAANSVHQSFFVGTRQRIEAYHSFSNIILLDTQTNELILSPQLNTDDLEIFPAFSPDGKTLYYSTSKSCDVPAEYEKVKCSLCSIPFDAETGVFGTEVDTLISGVQTGKSVTLARPSYNGRWLMFCMSERSNFPVFQNDADLWLMDMQTREYRPLVEVNSAETDSYHNWSSDSHWFVFSSRREDGMYTRLYLAGIDEHGKATKPFLLPQRNPLKYYQELFDAYNVPDFTKTKVSFNAHEASRSVFGKQRIQVKIRE